MKRRRSLNLLVSLFVLALLSTCMASAAWAGSNLFSGPINSPAARYAWGLAAGDFNGDHTIDLAVTNNNENLGIHSQVKVLLGNGDGTFQTPAGYAVGSTPMSDAVGDFNGDGKLDLAVANLREPNNGLGKISVLLGNGDGTFQKQTKWKASPVRVAVGDFNGDGKLDLAATRGGKRGMVGILLGNGDGTFKPEIKVPASPNPCFIAVGDVNGDGKLDLVVASQTPKYFTSVLLGNGDGTFNIAWSVESQGSATAIVLGDFDGDGKLDLAETFLGSKLMIRLGNGDGTFRNGSHYPLGRSPNAMAGADFDGDGNLDVAVADELDGNVGVFLGRGNGTFISAGNFPLQPVADPKDMIAVDVNGDGKPDLVVTDHDHGVVSVLLNTGQK